MLDIESTQYCPDLFLTSVVGINLVFHILVQFDLWSSPFYLLIKKIMDNDEEYNYVSHTYIATSLLELSTQLGNGMVSAMPFRFESGSRR